MTHSLSPIEIDRVVDAALAEDIGRGDLTSDAVLPVEARLKAAITAREDMVVCGLPVAQRVFQRLDPTVSFEAIHADGDHVGPGAVLAWVEGSARAVLCGERTALNILQTLSGIATTAQAYAKEVEGTGAVVLDTRKTLPGLRVLSKYATATGGATNHRMRLDDAVLIKDNHIAAAGSVAEAVRRCLARGLADIEVECDTVEQAEEALDAGARHLLLDNMSAATLKTVVPRLRARIAQPIKLEASGGVTLKNLRAIATTGVDTISTGRITQGAPAVDIGLDYG